MNTRERQHASTIAAAMIALRGAAPTATGATIILPDGTTTYVSRATAEAMAPDQGGGVPDGRPTPPHPPGARQ
jgi:hypothetical protein